MRGNALALVASLRCSVRSFSCSLLAPLLVLNTIQFHSPFKTGYDFWAPLFQWRAPSSLFTSLYSEQRHHLWNEFTLQPLRILTPLIYLALARAFVPDVSSSGLCRVTFHP